MVSGFTTSDSAIAWVLDALPMMGPSLRRVKSIGRLFNESRVHFMRNALALVAESARSVVYAFIGPHSPRTMRRAAAAH